MPEETSNVVEQLIETPVSSDFGYAVNETGDYRDTWRIFRIMAEFVEGYQFLTKLKDEVTIMGSARLHEGSPYYTIARELGTLLAKAKYTVITGGGPGIMEAANRGAHDVGGESIGLNIQLPFEQRINPYVTKSTAFYYFFTRKVMLTSPADAFVFFPGGFGTLDELLEVVDYMETHKLCEAPIILVGKDFWNPLLEFLRKEVGGHGIVHMKAINSWYVVDTAEEAANIIINKEDRVGPHACDLSPMNFQGSVKNMDWRIFRIMSELVEGFEFLTGLVEDVTVLGTKHISHDDPYYEAAYELGRKLALDGYATVTGGSHGIAEAVSKGAMEAGGETIGIGLEEGGKTRMNPYIMKSIMFKFPFTRKLIITAPSKAFVFFPGGFGTLHQLFEVLTLIQTKKMEPIPIMLYDAEYWKPMVAFIEQKLRDEYKTISHDDTSLFKIVDSVEEIAGIVNTARKKTKTIPPPV